ncbi:hypothetical protein [Rhizobium sp. RAF56]|uniref:hypothetical protein n=1 Tax=Rhizobium sp. RAF56 TaxID=3233062 RepID=UPI003F98EFCB
MPEPSVNVLKNLDALKTKRDYALLMHTRRVITISAAGISLLEREGALQLDYVSIGRKLFIFDSPENQERMAAIQKKREARMAAPAWIVVADPEGYVASEMELPRRGPGRPRKNPPLYSDDAFP